MYKSRQRNVKRNAIIVLVLGVSGIYRCNKFYRTGQIRKICKIRYDNGVYESSYVEHFCRELKIQTLNHFHYYPTKYFRTIPEHPVVIPDPHKIMKN